MAEIKKDQLESASKFMTAFWKEIVKPFYNPEDTEEWWELVITKIDAFGEKYDIRDKRLQKILIGFYNGIHEVYKDERNKGQAQ